MGTRSEALAGQFEQAFADLAKTIEGLNDEQLAKVCAPEGWTVAATAYHVGAQLPLEREFLVAAAEGKEMPSYTWDDINGINGRRATESTAIPKAEILKTMQENGTSMAKFVRSLSDEQLDRTASLPLAGGATVTTQQLLEGGVLIEHATSHLASIKAAV